jgi:hypothetical protein
LKVFSCISCCHGQADSAASAFCCATSFALLPLAAMACSHCFEDRSMFRYCISLYSCFEASLLLLLLADLTVSASVEGSSAALVPHRAFVVDPLLAARKRNK